MTGTLELIKPRLAQGEETTAKVARQVLAHCLDTTLRLLHPFVPFITEHLYGRLSQGAPKRGIQGLVECEESHSPLLVSAPWPKPAPELDDTQLMATFSDLQAATSGVREARAAQGLSPKQKVTVTLRPPAQRADSLKRQAHVMETLANVESLLVDPEAKRPSGAVSLMVGDLQIFVHDLVDDDAERSRLQKELKKIVKEIQICEKKLGNEKFVSRAPAAVVEEQRERKVKYQAQKMAVERSLAELS